MQKKYRTERKKEYLFVDEFKLKTGCKDCGYNKDAIALQFDHLRDKQAAISKLVAQGASKDIVLTEMAKCEVVCANCHAIRTRDRLRLN
jgi:hypothetical protein